MNKAPLLNDKSIYLKFMKEMIHNMLKEYYLRDDLMFVMPPNVFYDLFPSEEIIVNQLEFEIFGIKAVIDNMAETLYLMPKQYFGV